MSGENIINEHASWIEATARKLAFDFREPQEDCSQTLALYLLKGESKYGAYCRTVRELVRQRKWHSINQTCDALQLDRSAAQRRYSSATELADFLLDALSEDEFNALSWACFSLDQETIAKCIGGSQGYVSSLLASVKRKLEGEIND